MDAARNIDPQALLAQTGWVRGLARRLLRDEHAAEDVVQETWLAALEGAPAAGERRLRAWLAVVARNLALKRRRRELERGRAERAAAPPEVDTAGLGSGAGPEADEVARVQLHRRLVDAVLELEEPYRSTIVLRYFDGLSPQVIAQRKGVSPAAVRQRSVRGLRMLRARLDGEFGGDRAAWCLALAGLAADGGVPGGSWFSLIGGSVVGVKLAVGAAALAGVALLSVSLWPEVDSPADSVSAPLPQPAAVVSLPAPDGGAGRSAVALAGEARTGERSERQDRESAANHASDSVVTFADGPIEGQVLDATGRGLHLAWVRWATSAAAGDEPLLVETDERGRFELSLPATARAGPVTLEIGCAGHVPVKHEAHPGVALSVRLLSLPRVVGHVVDGDGSPVAPPGRVVLDLVAATDETVEVALEPGGLFSCEDLPLGRLARASALVKGYPEVELELRQALEPGGVLEVEIVVPRGVTVIGTVVDEVSQRAVAGASVWADTGDFDPESLHPTAVTDAQGRFELRGVDPGSHFMDDGSEVVVVRVLARAPGYSPTPTRAFAAMPNDAGRYEFEITMTRSGCSFGGRVLDGRDEAPVALAHVHGIDSLGNYSFTQTDEEGRFEFTDLPVGDFGLLAREGELDDADGGSSVRAELSLELGVHQDLKLVLAPGRASIVGRLEVQGDRSPADVEVHASYVFAHDGLAVSIDSTAALTAADGTYVIEGLPPGRFDVSLEGEASAQGCFEPRARGLELGEGERARAVDFQLGDCVSFAGQVLVGQSGHARLQVEIFDRPGEQRLDEVQVGADGSFRFERLAGLYELRLTGAGQVLARLEVGPDGATGLLLVAE